MTMPNNDTPQRTDTERLQWINDRVEEGRGAIEFGMNEDGYFGVWRNDSDIELGIGETVSEAIDAAMDAEGAKR